jgi:hypothetical protein
MPVCPDARQRASGSTKCRDCEGASAFAVVCEGVPKRPPQAVGVRYLGGRTETLEAGWLQTRCGPKGGETCLNITLYFVWDLH